MAAFMKLGDIKGEFAPSRKADGVSDQVAQFTNGGGGDSLTDAGLGNNSLHKGADVWTNGRATSIRDGVTASGFHGEFASKHDPLTGTGGDGFKKLDNITTGLGEAGVECQVPPSLRKPQEGLDSRLINHDDFLLVNNGGSTESVNGTIGYEMQVGMGISANARGKTTGTIAALQKEDIHCTGHCFDGGSTENLGTTSGPGGTSFLTGYAEAVGLDSSTVDVVTCPPCRASLGGDFI